MELDYLSVKEFAAAASVSVQSIYKRIGKPEDPIHQFLKNDVKPPLIAAAALEVIYNKTEQPKQRERAAAAEPQEITPYALDSSCGKPPIHWWNTVVTRTSLNPYLARY